MITLYHPTLDRHHTVATGPLADLYTRSGWERVDPDTLAARTRTELDQIAADADLDPSRFGTKAELAEAIVEHD